MEKESGLPPVGACDAAGLSEAMRRLKERSGLTFRELEERAARGGDVLARSTLADVLRRRTLPRPELLAAFVRACGQGDRVGVWLELRERIAAQGPVEAVVTDVGATGTPVTGTVSDRPPSRRLRFRAVGAAACALAAVLLALGVRVLLPDGSGGPDASGRPVDGWVTIRPARTPALCLTDGRDRGGAYPNAVAVQLPCAQAPVPRTYLEPAGQGLYRIQWHHPQEGKGCLTVMRNGPVKGMLEPWNDCGRATVFRVEATASGGAGGFRLRPAGGDGCIGITANDVATGAEAVEERCTGAADQRFLIRTG